MGTASFHGRRCRVVYVLKMSSSTLRPPQLAKISELSDPQLQSALLKYRQELSAAQEGEQKEKARAIFQQLQKEQQSRALKRPAAAPKNSTAKKAPSAPPAPKAGAPVSAASAAAGTGAAQTAGAAQAALRAKAMGKMSERNRSAAKASAKGRPSGGRAFPGWIGNSVMGSGVLVGLFGLLLLTDYYFGILGDSRKSWLFMIILPFAFGLFWTGSRLLDKDMSKELAAKERMEI